MFLFFRKNVFLKKAGFAALILLAAVLAGCSNGTTGTGVDAQNPTISVQPSGDSWDTTTPASFDLTVTASSPDGGTLSYQWYRNTNDSSGGGIKISSATSNTLSLVGSKYPTKGDYYFYVTITNIIADNGDGGVKTKTTTSDAAKVTVTNGDVYDVIPMPENLETIWEARYKTGREEYAIINTTFTSAWNDVVGYEGDIVNIRGKNGEDDSGYLTIKYTTAAYYPESVGNYYVIYWKNLTASTVDICASSDGKGKQSQIEAEAEYVLEYDYFEYPSSVKKQAEGEAIEPPVPEFLKANWSGENEESGEHHFNIKANNTLTYSMMAGAPTFDAKIVKVIELDNDSGYLVFQYIYFYTEDDSFVDKYCVLYYDELTASGAKLAIFNDGADGTFGDAGVDTPAEAEATYVISNSDYYDPDYDLISCTN